MSILGKNRILHVARSEGYQLSIDTMKIGFRKRGSYVFAAAKQKGMRLTSNALAGVTVVSFILIAGEGKVLAQGSTVSTSTPNFTNAGSSGSDFAKIWVGARASAMGGAFAAMADDITSLYWNPAGIARMDGVNVGADYTRWFGDVTHNFIGVTMPISEHYRIGISLTEVDYGDLNLSTITQDANAGTYNANDLSFGATIAGSLTDRFSFGMTAKYLRSSLLDLSADGFAFDAGSLYVTDFYHRKISMDLSNLGPDRSFSGNSLTFVTSNQQINSVQELLNASYTTGSFALPLIFRIGLATDVFQGTVENQKLNVDFDYSTHSDGPDQMDLGAEYLWNDIAAFRA